MLKNLYPRRGRFLGLKWYEAGVDAAGDGVGDRVTVSAPQFVLVESQVDTALLLPGSAECHGSNSHDVPTYSYRSWMLDSWSHPVSNCS